ncbi:tRNA/rRNA methyltransferase YsgA [Spatholobus suberectus]|nr:tRNA/rRNA methyltransferase YsgA [Spatholobus suberectus]
MKFIGKVAIVVELKSSKEICRFRESLQDGSVLMDCLILPDKAEIPDGLDKSTASIVRVNFVVMRKLSGLQTTDSLDAIALMKIPPSFFNVDDEQKNCQKWFPSIHRILVLDGIQDPGNLGTLLRSAVAFRWDGVFLLPGCCDPFNEKALRASRGASFQLPIVSGSWNHVESLKEEFQMKLLAGHQEHEGLVKPVCLLSPSFCDSLSDIPLCLVLGSEGSGLSEKPLQECELVSIAMAGEYESLNVSVAGGIFLYTLQAKNR